MVVAVFSGESCSNHCMSFILYVLSILRLFLSHVNAPAGWRRRDQPGGRPRVEPGGGIREPSDRGYKASADGAAYKRSSRERYTATICTPCRGVQARISRLVNEICLLLPDKRASYTCGKARISVQMEVASTLGRSAHSGHVYRRSTGLWTPRPPRLSTWV
jgi:hypothetical protein